MTTPNPAPDAPAVPGPDELLGRHLPDVLAACAQHTGKVTRFERATGGNVSHVFRVHGDAGHAILKVRGNRFANIPTLSTDPALIADEHRALGIYGQALPDHFPRMLAFLPQAHAMIMTDVFPDGRTWHEHLDQRPATTDEVTRLGRALAHVHRATAAVRTPIRSQGDDWFREHTFDFCLRPGRHPVLLDACTELAALPCRQLVLGDVAPKNLSLAAGRVAFVDLDNVHRNSPLYDVAYLLAHILLHHLRWPAEAPALATALLSSYGDAAPHSAQSDEVEALTATLAAGVLLYRLAALITPYPLTAPLRVGEKYRRLITHLLDSGNVTLPRLLGITEQAAA
ncbi:phosphotransferase [Streptomyces sp. NPDC093085]|uniref:phosphotransferase n=1 Tax=Streptomyces sp. NPDC093085 TaxID=3155068 RepID=UPI00343A3831